MGEYDQGGRGEDHVRALICKEHILLQGNICNQKHKASNTHLDIQPGTHTSDYVTALGMQTFNEV